MSKKQTVVIPYGVHEEMMRRPFATARHLANKQFLPKEAVKNIFDYNQMNFRRETVEYRLLRRKETKLTDIPVATTEREGNRITGKYIHTPYIITEPYSTEREIVDRVTRAVLKAVGFTLAGCALIITLLCISGHIIFNF